MRRFLFVSCALLSCLPAMADTAAAPAGANAAQASASNTNQTDAAKDKQQAAMERLKNAKENENSFANQALTTGSGLLSGAGAMAAASAYSEQKADEEAEAAMREYLATFKCSYGDGQFVDYGVEETLPISGLLADYKDYTALAEDLKKTKTALGLRPGIESEILYEKSQTGLYEYSTAVAKEGYNPSLARALLDSSSADATALAEQKKETSTKLTAGLVTAGVGIVGGLAVNLAINGNKSSLVDDDDVRHLEIEYDGIIGNDCATDAQKWVVADDGDKKCLSAANASTVVKCKCAANGAGGNEANETPGGG